MLIFECTVCKTERIYGTEMTHDLSAAPFITCEGACHPKTTAHIYKKITHDDYVIGALRDQSMQHHAWLERY